MGGPPVSQNEYGYWIDAQGGIAATDPEGRPQVTPGMQGSPSGALQYDPAKDLYFFGSPEHPQYVSPYSYAGQAQGTAGGTTAPEGGFFHGRGTWNPETGQFEQGLQWGNLLSLAIGGGLGLGALNAAGVIGGAGAGGAGGAGAASSTAVPAGAASGAAGAGSAGAGAATTAGSAAAAAGGGMGVWDVVKSVLPSIIGGAFQVGGAKIGADATKEAAQIQAETAAKALEAAKQLYQQERADLGPWRSTGGGAIAKLGGLWGVTPAADASIPGNPYGSAQTTPAAATHTAAGPLPTSPLPTTPLGANVNGLAGGLPNVGGTQSGLVKVRAPSGDIVQIPAGLLDQALQYGGTVVNG